MDTDGTYEARGPQGEAPPAPVNRPPAPVPAQAPPLPSTPPRPAGLPARAPEAAGGAAVAEWLDAPRPKAGLGIWRFRHVEPPLREPARLAPITVVGLLIPLVIGLILWSAWRRGTVPYLWIPLQTLTPAEWWHSGTTSPRDWRGAEAHVVYSGVIFLLIAYAVARLGSWGKVIHHYLDRFGPGTRAALSAAGALAALVFVWPDAFGVGWDPLPIAQPVLSLVVLIGDGYTVLTSPFLVYPLYALITAAVVWPFARVGKWREALAHWRNRPAPVRAAAPQAPASQWPELRAAGEQRAAERLTAEVRAGRMNDVDCARVSRAWTLARGDARRRAALVDTVVEKGAATALHPSGGRDLPRRAGEHDLLLGQVRIGRYAPAERTPHAYTGAGLALDPGLLGTSLLAVGPSGAGKTRRLTAPVVEALTLQALTGACAVVAVGAPGAPLGPDDAYDVVIRIGDPASRHDLDLYAGAGDPDEAAALLAEGLVGDVEGVETRRAATALAQLIGPYREAHGAFPTVPALRELLEARPETLQVLLDRLPQDAAPGMRRELESRIRQVGTVADVGPALADRLASLDRPVFAEFFGGGSGTVRPFSLRSVGAHPLRVRITLPEGGHEETARLLARLLLAQFETVARADTGRKHFVCLVLDDAAGALTPGTVRGLARLRPQNAGAVLALRSLAEVPEALHGQLLAAVGCRMAFSGVTTWDGRAFAEAWGTERVETTEVAQHTVFADQPMTRALHAVRKMVTGKAVTTDAVTVREVERERWSASELAHEVPAGHAVLSLTHVRGGSTPPLLVDLRG
ncbi:ATP/GTP-binding protein [Streptomyces sp. HUAS MG47]|uniref:ATP/GTP-binding protein n=1 Tax=Streptomyces solicamelliae TaxID=3231716 RepID=UPI0038780FB3